MKKFICLSLLLVAFTACRNYSKVPESVVADIGMEKITSYIYYHENEYFATKKVWDSLLAIQWSKYADLPKIKAPSPNNMILDQVVRVDREFSAVYCSSEEIKEQVAESNRWLDSTATAILRGRTDRIYNSLFEDGIVEIDTIPESDCIQFVPSGKSPWKSTDPSVLEILSDEEPKFSEGEILDQGDMVRVQYKILNWFNSDGDPRLLIVTYENGEPDSYQLENGWGD